VSQFADEVANPQLELRNRLATRSNKPSKASQFLLLSGCALLPGSAFEFTEVEFPEASVRCGPADSDIS
jgi:hypothetical protein